MKATRTRLTGSSLRFGVTNSAHDHRKAAHLARVTAEEDGRAYPPLNSILQQRGDDNRVWFTLPIRNGYVITISVYVNSSLQVTNDSRAVRTNGLMPLISRHLQKGWTSNL